ncbi:MAG: pentapeptide repeat-containing protein [Alphaproteobacteria bacterium]|nr:pentapeptide repeat-containing protein [Alphaproteobacteria bacterium]MBL7099171.1 pentapeptide repeat-containing protein [Alphaproteobacteria bacterium]
MVDDAHKHYEAKRKPLDQRQLAAALMSHTRYLASQGGVRAQLAHHNLDGLNLANRNLTEADFTGCSLIGANLSGSNLDRASLYCADLRDANLQSSRLTRADLRGASFAGARLAYAQLDNADMRTATMMYMQWGGDVAVVGGERSKASGNPKGVDFSNCSLKNVSFGSAKLDDANFSGALLQGANFKGARLGKATFKGAVLTGVKDLTVPPGAIAGAVRDVTPEAAAKFDQLKAQLESHQTWVMSAGANGVRAVLDGEDLRPLRQLFVSRTLTGLSARNAVAIGLDFSGSQLQAAKFDGADLRDANFSNADLRGASFRGANLAHACFDGANLNRLKLNNGSEMKPDFSGAQAAEVQFHRATLGDQLAELGLSLPSLRDAGIVEPFFAP